MFSVNKFQREPKGQSKLDNIGKHTKIGRNKPNEDKQTKTKT